MAHVGVSGQRGRLAYILLFGQQKRRVLQPPLDQIGVYGFSGSENNRASLETLTPTALASRSQSGASVRCRSRIRFASLTAS